MPGVVQCKDKDNTLVLERWSEKEENLIWLLNWLSLNVKATLLTVQMKWKDKDKDLVKEIDKLKDKDTTCLLEFWSNGWIHAECRCSLLTGIVTLKNYDTSICLQEL